jgi:ABC-type transport system involved in multi-copper enzyme maturation permease subunit
MVRANLGFYLHTRRFKVVFPLYIVLALIVPILYGVNALSKPPDIYSYTEGALSEFVFATVLLVAMLAGDAISQDFGRQGFFTLTQPVRRSEIMLARTLAAFIFSSLAMLVWIGIGLISGLIFYTAVVPSAWLILLLAALFVGSVVSFVVLFSSLFKTPTTSVVISVVIVWFLMPVISGVLDLAGIEPWFLITYAGGVVEALASQVYPAHITTITATGGLGAGPTVTVSTYTPYVWEATAIMAAYLVISLALGWLIYSRKELTETS